MAEESRIGISELLRKARMKHDAGFLQHVAMGLTIRPRSLPCWTRRRPLSFWATLPGKQFMRLLCVVDQPHCNAL